MKTRNVIVDFDETLALTIMLLFHFIARELGVTVTDKDMDSYMSWEERFGVSTEKIDELEAKFYVSPEYLSLKLDPVAIRVLRMIKKDLRCSWIDILTARNVKHRLATYELVRQEPHLFRRAYHVKNDIDGYRCKVEVYARYFEQAFMFVDDTVKYAVKAARLYPHLYVFLLQKRWNQKEIRMFEHSEISYDNLYIVKDWNRIEELVTPMIHA